MQTSPDSLERLVVEAIGAACRIEPAAIARSTPLLDMNMDSLTLVTVLGLIEVAYGFNFDADDIVQMLRARDVAELCAVVARKLESATDENPCEDAGIASCATHGFGMK